MNLAAALRRASSPRMDDDDGIQLARAMLARAATPAERGKA